MGIKYRASMSKRDYKKLPVEDLTEQDTTRVYICDAITIIPDKNCVCGMFDYLDIAIHTIDKPAIKVRCGVDAIEIDSYGMMMDVEHKTKYMGLFPARDGLDTRLMVHWDGCFLKINTLTATIDENKTV